ncbi:MAG: RNase adapter RapZ [Polyangiaceae bacterium]
MSEGRSAAPASTGAKLPDGASGDETTVTSATRVVVVTGLSGAGKSTALHALEDLGYFCVDNIPTKLAAQAVEVLESGGIHRIALGMDVRVRAFLDDTAPALARIRDSETQPREVRVLFLDASDATLLRRFSETRRPHPLAFPPHPGQRGDAEGLPSEATRRGSSLGVLDGILLERERLAPLRAQATIDIDTTRLSVHELRRQVITHLGPGADDQPRMSTRVVSFGYKYGVPVDADLLFDVRFIDNPYFVPELKHLSGVDAAVRDHVLALPEARQFLEKIEDLLAFALPRYEREGKAHLTVAVGCTGGRHRSVALANVLGQHLSERLDRPVTVVHRDMARSDTLEAGSVAGAASLRPPSTGATGGGGGSS